MISFTLDADDVDKLDEICAKEDRSRSWVIRNCVKAMVAAHVVALLVTAGAALTSCTAGALTVTRAADGSTRISTVIEPQK